MKFNMENIVVDGDPKLRMPSVDIKVPVSDTDLELIQAMVDFVKRSQTDSFDDNDDAFTSAVGMSAPQFGINKRIFVVTEIRDNKQVFHVVVNPKIVKRSDKFIKLSTGENCLSVPNGKSLKLNRSRDIRWNGYLVDPEDGSYEQKKMSPAKGYDSIVFQHEYDHLEGLLYIDREPGVIHGI